MDCRVKISPGTGLVLTVLYFEEQLFRCLAIYIYNIIIIGQMTERLTGLQYNVARNIGPSHPSQTLDIWWNSKYWFCLFVPIYCARCCIECYSEDLVILSGENNLFWGEKEVAHYWCCCKLHLTAEHPTAPPSPPRCITTWDAAQMAWCHFEMHLCWFSVLKLPLLETLCSV